MSAAPDVTVILPVPASDDLTLVMAQALNPLPPAPITAAAPPTKFYDELMAELRPSAFDPEWVVWEPWWPRPKAGAS